MRRGFGERIIELRPERAPPELIATLIVTVQGIDLSAQWMWYNEDPATISNPFLAGPEGSDGHHEFLIFRIPVRNIPAPGASALLLLAPVCARRRR